jgi:hypothetical protein
MTCHRARWPLQGGLAAEAGNPLGERASGPSLRVDSNHRPHDYESCTGRKRRRNALKPGQKFPCKSDGSLA